MKCQNQRPGDSIRGCAPAACRLATLLLLLALLHLFPAGPALGQQLAFPSAEGYGRFATGGRGGSVCKVTRLANSGAGTFRNCIENTSGPRTVVFDTSGTIVLTSQVRPSSGRITIAGQSAPGNGIFITGGGLWLDGVSNVIVRHIRVGVADSPQKPNSRDSARSGDNQIWDHNTILWSTDENFDVFGDDVTLQYNIIGEALRSAGHGDGNHSRGLMMGSGSNLVRRGSFYRNLITDTDGRTPIIYNCNPCDYINNVTYNAGDYVLWNTRLEPMEMNVHGNYFKWGPNMNRNVAYKQVNAFGFGNAGDIWFYGNCDTRDRPNDTGSQTANLDAHPNYNTVTSAGGRFTGSSYPSYAEETDCLTALAEVPTQAGAAYPVRLAGVEERIESDVINSRGGAAIVDLADAIDLRPSIPVVSRGGSFDTDGDGIPNAWEVEQGLNPSSSADGAQLHSNGYTNLENYLNQLAGDDVPGLSGSGSTPTAPSPPSDVSISTG